MRFLTNAFSEEGTATKDHDPMILVPQLYTLTENGDNRHQDCSRHVHLAGIQHHYTHTRARVRTRGI